MDAARGPSRNALGGEGLALGAISSGNEQSSRGAKDASSMQVECQCTVNVEGVKSPVCRTVMWLRMEDGEVNSLVAVEL